MRRIRIAVLTICLAGIGQLADARSRGAKHGVTPCGGARSGSHNRPSVNGHLANIDYPPVRIRRTLDVNVVGPFLGAREAVRRMAASRGGRGGGIVNVSSRAAQYGSPREPEEMARAILWLLSDDASYSTGTFLDVSGDDNDVTSRSRWAMANDEYLARLRRGVEEWNAWRTEGRDYCPDFSEADLPRADLAGANLQAAILTGANLSGARLDGANLSFAKLDRADLTGATLRGTNLNGANLTKANLRQLDLTSTTFSNVNCTAASLSAVDLTDSHLKGVTFDDADLSDAKLNNANLIGAKCSRANLRGAWLSGANLQIAFLHGANLEHAFLNGAHLYNARLVGACLKDASLEQANLFCADLRDANLRGANLDSAILVRADLGGADLTGSRVFGVSAWGLSLQRTKQQDLIITGLYEPTVTVDNIEVAQFVYLLLHNEKIRDVIDTVGKKGVLLLGRFSEGRIQVLERLRDELRKRGYLPIIFNFDKPETKNFTETVRLLAGLSQFVIADVTNPRSAPLELQATIPEVMVPFRPIIQEGEKPFEMLEDLWMQHRDWVFEPLYYSSVDALVGALDERIIKPAKIRVAELLARKAEKMKGEHV